MLSPADSLCDVAPSVSLCVQAALLQKLKSQVGGSEKMLALMMGLLNQPEAGNSAGSAAESGHGQQQPVKTEAGPSYARWGFFAYFFEKIYEKNILKKYIQYEKNL